MKVGNDTPLKKYPDVGKENNDGKELIEIDISCDDYGCGSMATPNLSEVQANLRLDRPLHPSTSSYNSSTGSSEEADVMRQPNAYVSLLKNGNQIPQTTCVSSPFPVSAASRLKQRLHLIPGVKSSGINQ